MSCVNILDNDTTLVTPTFTGAHPCTVAQVPNCDAGGYLKTGQASANLQFHPDGTWRVTGGGGGGANCGGTVASPSGVLASGSWITGAFTPSDFEVRFTGTQRYEYDTVPPVGAFSSCPNPEDPIGYDPPYDSGWLPLTAIRQIESTISINNTYVCINSVTAINAFNVQLRQISNNANAVNGSGSICAQVIQTTTN